MGWRDRPYAREDFEPDRGSRPMRPRMRFGTGFSPVVLWLLAANVAVFVVDMLVLVRVGVRAPSIGGLNWVDGVVGGQAWRFVTYMFIHAGFWHILLNMLMLYFLGPTLERRMGAWKFLLFYVGCGLAGGAAYAAYGWSLGDQAPVVGASGATLGIMIGFAILNPEARLILFIFPIKARTLAIIYSAWTVFNVFAPYGGGGVAHAAHFGGMVFAAAWFYLVPRWRGTFVRAKAQRQKGAWERKLRLEAEEQEEVDEILDKIKALGIDSLTRREKRALKEATRRQHEEDRRRRQRAKDTYM